MIKRIVFLTISIVTLTGCSETPKPQDNPNNKLALEEISREPKVKEAMITDANVLYVTVEDDGTRRDGYAGYLCEVLNDHKATPKMVKVVKVNSSKDPDADNAYGVLLGEMNCEF